MRKLSLKTDLSVNECVERLEKAIVKESFLHPFASFGMDGVSGRVKGNEFRLQKRKMYGNSFTTLCWAKLISTGAGTAVECRFDIRPFVKVFVFFLFGFFLLGIMFSIVKLSSEGKMALINVATTWLFAVAFIWFCKRLARNEQGYLTDFLMITLAAKEDMSKPLGF